MTQAVLHGKWHSYSRLARFMRARPSEESPDGLSATLLILFTESNASMSPPVPETEATTTDQQLRLFIERVERLEEEKKGIADDIRDVYAEAKSMGYDAKIMRQIVRLRKLSANDRAEMEALLDTYKAALGLG